MMMRAIRFRYLSRGALRAALGCMFVAAVWVALSAAPASASVEIESFTSGGNDSQAGGHPDLTTSFRLKDPGSPEAARNVIFDAPRGVFGNPEAIGRCSSLEFALQECFPGSQAGLITLHANYKGDPNYLLGTVPVFNMAVPRSQVAMFAFIVPELNIPITIPITVRTADDYGLRFTVSNITQATPLAAADLIFWGFPFEFEHDAERFAKGSPGNPAGCPGLADVTCISEPTPSSQEVHPLIDNPTTCTGEPLVTTLKVQSYQDLGHLSEAHSTYPAITGCENEVFKPVLFSRPTTTESDSATGVDIELKDPLFLGFAASPSQIRSAAVQFPPGLTINPDAADGQIACTDAQANFGSEGPDQCPDNAKIGTIAIKSIALAEPLEGSLYFGEPKPGDQYRIFMMANGYGIHAKLVGSAKPDPTTGQVTVYFQDLPQVPFNEFDVHLFASDRGLMATPTFCSFYNTTALFTPWNASVPPVTSVEGFGLDSGPNGARCPEQIRPFNPRLEAGTSDAAAGAYSSFILKLDRDDGDQFLGDLNFKMPPGFTGNLRGISYCSEAEIAHAAGSLGRSELANPSCPGSSLIGTTIVAAGPGGHPFHALGKVYLAGPFKGASLSLAAVTPALAGPYDYGTVVVRVALHVNPQTAQVDAVSDTVPSIIGGVPIRMRSIQVNTNRTDSAGHPNFTINPTNCSQFAVESQGVGAEGTTADFSSPFHVDNCKGLGFKPKMTVRQLGKRRQTRRSQDPALRFDLWTRPGDANIKSLSVTLPKAFAIDQRHLGNICSRAELAAKLCEGRQAIGTAWVKSPQLDQPLEGAAYAVSGFGTLPHVVFILRGQVMLLPGGESTTVNGRLKTVVPVIPDAQIGHFRLDLFGGKQGYLVNTRSLCASASTVSVAFTGQNGAHLTKRVRTKTACGGRKTKHAHLRR